MAAASAHRRALWSLYVPAMLLGVPAQASFVLLPLYGNLRPAEAFPRAISEAATAASSGHSSSSF